MLHTLLTLVTLALSICAWASVPETTSVRLRHISPEVLEMIQRHQGRVIVQDYKVETLDVNQPMNGDDLECEHSDRRDYCVSAEKSEM